MSRRSVREDIRLAGEVDRFHTWPHLRSQSVGEHSWQLARILMSITPQFYWSTLLPHAIVHDVGELTCGDAPYPLKIRNPELGSLLRDVEVEARDDLLELWGVDSLSELTPSLHDVLKLAEFIEMWEWAQSEMSRGNQYAAEVEGRCYSEIAARIAALRGRGTVDNIVARVALYLGRREEFNSVR